MNVIDVSVPVVVNSVAWNLARVSPNVGCQIGVVELHAGVEDRDLDRPGTGAGVPRRRRSNALHSPKFVQSRIVRGHLDAQLVVGLRVTHVWGTLEHTEGLLYGRARRQVEKLQAGDKRVDVGHGCVNLGPHRPPFGGRGSGVEANEYFTRGITAWAIPGRGACRGLDPGFTAGKRHSTCRVCPQCGSNSHLVVDEQPVRSIGDRRFCYLEGEARSRADTGQCEPEHGASDSTSVRRSTNL